MMDCEPITTPMMLNFNLHGDLYSYLVDPSKYR
jgi:hypothetical protein